MKLALSGRDEEALEPVLSFITRYIGHPDFSDVLADVTSMVLGASHHVQPSETDYATSAWSKCR